MLAYPTYASPEKPVILVLGDSLSTGYGIEQKAGWVNLLQERLTKQSYSYQVINASISGDTTRGALSRTKRALDSHRPGIVIIELGGNDGLRGLSLDQTKNNLATIIEECLGHEVRVLLAGIRLPPNYGSHYTKKFHDIYVNLADKYDLPLLSFILEGVAEKPELMQVDGIHPRTEAQVMILDNIWPLLQPLLDKKS
jgi:acyl-CoA thioesterase-1